jgi:hypothetical protein
MNYLSERMRTAQITPLPASRDVIAFGSCVSFGRADGRRPGSAVARHRAAKSLNCRNLSRRSVLWLLAPVADKGGGHAEANEHAAGDVTFPAQEVTVALDPSPSRAGGQCIETIARQVFDPGL